MKMIMIIFSLDFISVNLSVKHNIVLGLVSAISTETSEGHDGRQIALYKTTDKFTLLANGLIQLHEILKHIQYKTSPGGIRSDSLQAPASNLFMAKGHSRYNGTFRGPHVEK
jgi:hypothetical protein